MYLWIDSILAAKVTQTPGKGYPFFQPIANYAFGENNTEKFTHTSTGGSLLSISRPRERSLNWKRHLQAHRALCRRPSTNLLDSHLYIRNASPCGEAF